ncbi:hypothetical protein BGW80DRAFT_1365513 [Lactifluus volemus]|nr:hypothetical protein BGW80DRAFT_1365513 [Lactifluus volemus]
MSTVLRESSGSPSGSAVSSDNLLFDLPEADVILRSCDSFEFRVLKSYILHSSPILCEKVLTSPDPQFNATTITSKSELRLDAASLPVIQLPDTGVIILSLLSYIYHVPPIVPATIDQVMELLSVAQRYKMDVVLTRIRSHIAQQDPPLIREETALQVYSLAQRCGLREEMLQAARSTLALSPLTIDGLEDKLDMMPGACLYELWKYHERVKSNLAQALCEFRTSHAQTLLGNSACESLTASRIPTWLDSFIENIGRDPAFLDLTRFHLALSTHVQSPQSRGKGGCVSCAYIHHKTIRAFWAALTAVANGGITKAEPTLLVVEERAGSGGHATSSREFTSSLKPSPPSMADVILQSADLVNFRVHRSALVASSPFFDAMFSLPQPPNGETVDGLPVVHLSENAEILNSLISMLYPVTPAIPDTDDNILALIAATEKYDMVAVRSSIRAEVSRRGLLAPKGVEAFRVHAVACSKRLYPEMAITARLTLDYPMTFEYLGEALRSYEGWALRDLVNFRQRCSDQLDICIQSFLDYRKGPSKIWVGCPAPAPFLRSSQCKNNDPGFLATWLQNLLWKLEPPLVGAPAIQTLNPCQFRKEYLEALQEHVKQKDCHFCTRVHTMQGEAFCAEIEKGMVQARNIVYSFLEGIQ